MLQSGIAPAVLAAIIGMLGALLGLTVAGFQRHTRLIVPFSGGLLLGVALFGLLPELVADIGWSAGAPLFALGYLLLGTVDRYLWRVCPTCSHDHVHESCASALHGFAAPLAAATALHCLVDGWGLVTTESATRMGVRLAVPIAIALHKIPEGIALAVILRAAVGSNAAAFAWSAAAEGATVVGGAFALAMTIRLPGSWTSYPLAIAGGFFLYLGFHAIHAEWKRRGAIPAVMPALTGAVGAAALQQGVRAFLR